MLKPNGAGVIWAPVCCVPRCVVTSDVGKRLATSPGHPPAHPGLLSGLGLLGLVDRIVSADASALKKDWHWRRV